MLNVEHSLCEQSLHEQSPCEKTPYEQSRRGITVRDGVDRSTR